MLVNTPIGRGFSLLQTYCHLEINVLKSKSLYNLKKFFPTVAAAAVCAVSSADGFQGGLLNFSDRSSTIILIYLI